MAAANFQWVLDDCCCKLFWSIDSVLSHNVNVNVAGISENFWNIFQISKNDDQQLTVNAAGWNKLHFASARTFINTQMFAVHNRAHKNRVLMSLSCSGAKISPKTHLCQAIYKIQIRTTLNVLCRPSWHLICCSLKQYHVSQSNIGFLCPSYMLCFERAPCMFLCWLWQGRFRTIGIISTIPEPKENNT